jgi:diaminohydroxyphosphoribosylaminopyrimidine deaminase/5-amino-6-(5-phosphoribosylamino)uracil reductase
VGNREIPTGAKIADNRAAFYHHQSRDFSTLISELQKRNVVSVLVEAGSTLGSELLKAGLIDEIAIFTAPKILGAGNSFINDLGITNISEAKELKLIESKQFEGDLFNRYQVVR